MATAPLRGLLVLITAKHSIFACGNRVTSHGRQEIAQGAPEGILERRNGISVVHGSDNFCLPYSIENGAGVTL